MIRLLCIVELHDARTLAEAQAKLNAFREAVQPSQNYNVTIYRATSSDIEETIHTTGFDEE